MNIQKRLIPINYTEGRAGKKPIAIVMHLMDGNLKGTDAWFRNPDAKASTHYGVGKDGTVYQWVDEADMAWANGRVDAPKWRLLDPKVNPNLVTVSIEHEGVTGHVWTPEQYKADVELVRAIAGRYGIPLDRDHIIGHSEIYAKKPNCPGKGFDFDLFMSMLNQPTVKSIYRNIVVKGDKKSDCYWLDNAGFAHGLPNWAFYLKFFNKPITTLPQATVDAIPKGDTFTA